mgnify:CR=1 FL=1
MCRAGRGAVEPCGLWAAAYGCSAAVALIGPPMPAPLASLVMSHSSTYGLMPPSPLPTPQHNKHLFPYVPTYVCVCVFSRTPRSKVGDPFSSVEQGPQVDDDQFKKILSYIDRCE